MGLFVADLAISLDVVYHLIEDQVFEAYMKHLFAAGKRYVVVYSTNKVMRGDAPHVRTAMDSHCAMETQCRARPEPLPRRADFFVYERENAVSPDR